MKWKELEEEATFTSYVHQQAPHEPKLLDGNRHIILLLYYNLLHCLQPLKLHAIIPVAETVTIGLISQKGKLKRKGPFRNQQES